VELADDAGDGEVAVRQADSTVALRPGMEDRLVVSGRYVGAPAR
jgi:hypothetical protein